MLSKITDTASILKAKITKDELEQKLIQATSEQNWQTPTNILHEIANAAYNYEKWQRINDFIWDKLKKKSTWRKIIKSLNLVQFLIKNGPPSAISSFKYDIYQFRAFNDFSLYEEGTDRGEAIRQKSKQIVQLLSNEQTLEQQRQKAKKIRQKMANITGGGSYGGYTGQTYGGGGDGRYQSFNSKNYQSKGTGNASYGSSDYGGLGVYGDYSYGKSTLDKYKNEQKNNKKGQTPSINKPLIVPDITGAGGAQFGQQANKKPFEKLAKKLQKPGQKAVKPDPPSPAKNTNPKLQTPDKNKNTTDFFQFDQVTNPPTPNQAVIQNQPLNQTKPVQIVGLSQPQVPTQVQPLQDPLMFQQPLYPQGFSVNPGYIQQPQPQPQLPQQFGYPQQAYGQNFAQPYNNPYNQPYGQAYGQQFNQQYGQPFAQPYPNPYAHQYPQPAQQFTLTPTVPSTNSSKSSQITLQSKPKSQPQQFSNFGAPSSSSANVNWLSNEEKGLIDFSDFGKELKNTGASSTKKQDKGNNITIDTWAGW